PSLTLPSAPPAIGAEVTLIGDGRANSPGDAEKQWAVTGTFPNYVWTEVSSGGNAAGYTSNRFAKLWGTNRVEDDEPFFGEGDANHTVNVNAGFGQVISLFSVFDAPSSSNATASEAQALVGDSGSAVFAKIGAEWNLVGISHAIGVFPQQPGFENPPLVPPAPQSAVYGNLTYFADLSRYRDQILSITAIPEAGSFALVGAAMAMAGATAWGRRRTDNRRQA
ncbi:MAG TPA: hypothetical protein PJ982_09790, partial [Lacipirellulaceae bacterium]|nr:hypothetical protein [Lacipirellulaceae bacterium]